VTVRPTNFLWRAVGVASFGWVGKEP